MNSIQDLNLFRFIIIQIIYKNLYLIYTELLSWQAEKKNLLK